MNKRGSLDQVGLGQHDRPVIWVRQEFEPELRDTYPEMIRKGIQITIKGAYGSQIAPGLGRRPFGPSGCEEAVQWVL